MDNKQAAKRFFEDVFNRGDLKVLDQIYDRNADIHDPYIQRLGRGSDAMKEFVKTYRDAFSDLRFVVDQQLAEGDYVVTRWTATGTNDGDFMGNPATNREGTVTGTTIHRLRDGKIVESWNHWDMFGMFQQLGFVPQAERAAAK